MELFWQALLAIGGVAFIVWAALVLLDEKMLYEDDLRRAAELDADDEPY